MQNVIAVDAMGSDRAPKPEIEGALHAARQFGVKVLLVGPEHQLNRELAGHPARHVSVEVVNATEIIGMHEKAAHAVRAKKGSTMRVGLQLVRDKLAAGFVTAGNTGASLSRTNCRPTRMVEPFLAR